MPIERYLGTVFLLLVSLFPANPIAHIAATGQAATVDENKAADKEIQVDEKGKTKIEESGPCASANAQNNEECEDKRGKTRFIGPDGKEYEIAPGGKGNMISEGGGGAGPSASYPLPESFPPQSENMPSIPNETGEDQWGALEKSLGQYDESAKDTVVGAGNSEGLYSPCEFDVNCRVQKELDGVNVLSKTFETDGSQVERRYTEDGRLLGETVSRPDGSPLEDRMYAYRYDSQKDADYLMGTRTRVYNEDGSVAQEVRTGYFADPNSAIDTKTDPYSTAYVWAGFEPGTVRDADLNAPVEEEGLQLGGLDKAVELGVVTPSYAFSQSANGAASEAHTIPECACTITYASDVSQGLEHISIAGKDGTPYGEVRFSEDARGEIVVTGQKVGGVPENVTSEFKVAAEAPLFAKLSTDSELVTLQSWLSDYLFSMIPAHKMPPPTP